MTASDSTDRRDSTVSAKPEPFLFLYFLELQGIPVLREAGGAVLGWVHDFAVRATTPYPTVCGMEIRTAEGPRLLPWSAVQDLNNQAAYLIPGEPAAPPAFDYTVRRDLLRKLAVEVSATSVVRVWDIHFVYSEGKMVLAHAETGIRGLLRTLRMEKPVMATLGAMLPAPVFRERFATFRHLQILRDCADGTMHIPARVLEMHPADLASVLKQLPGRLRRHVFNALPVDAAARVLQEAESRLQSLLLAACPPARRETVCKLMNAPRDTQQL